MKTVTLLLLLTGLLTRARGWQNSYDGPLNFKCPAGQSIYSITSENNDHYEDRVWDFSCQATNGQTSQCYWTSYINNFDQVLFFECPAQQVVAGMSSYHNNNYEDRRWQFYCCKSMFNSANCHWTSYVNSFDEYFHWTVPNQNVLTGVHSYHQNNVEDRRWMYKVCAQNAR
ncbi:hypothetical protein QQF64_012741 [Cirrhinus molitorella]|uniref:Dermatopontin n=1 Tax=Cirrhinus molitorella TaxID=172907 RepID=A0ABR3LWC6_9TELE